VLRASARLSLGLVCVRSKGLNGTCRDGLTVIERARVATALRVQACRTQKLHLVRLARLEALHDRDGELVSAPLNDTLGSSNGVSGQSLAIRERINAPQALGHDSTNATPYAFLSLEVFFCGHWVHK